ncbi:MAG: sodium-dependent bicarbonate transport family permease [Actinomycetales bacterium mxb001]|nr:MAG: sodium-dependent bicarbonate transport family permease [Actinomycetales bacterium mxb001]
MDLQESLSLALTNLTSPPVLAFVLGLVAVAVKTDLRLPDAVYQATSIYLLLAIGIKGGVALRESSASDVAWPILAAIVLGIAIPVAAFFLLRVMTPLGRIDRGALAAHYGSTSLVTFTAALVFLQASLISYEGYVVTLLTILEIPGIIVGLLLAQGVRGDRFGETLREVVLGRSVLLLVGGLVIGFLTGPVGYARVEPFFGGLFIGVLTLFLLELGMLTGRQLSAVRQAGPGLIAFAILFPLLAGTAGVVGGTLAGMSIGGAMVLGVLCASASYIAAPAAVRLALPEAKPSITLVSSLGITFPFNLVIGIPVYLLLAEAIGGWLG